MTIRRDALAKGIKRVTSDGSAFIVIDIVVMYADAPNVLTLAKDFRLPPEEILKALILHPSNEDARRTVFDNEAPDPTVPSTDVDRFVRDQLVILAFENEIAPGRRVMRPKKRLFEKWQVVPNGNFLTLPLSSSFSSLLTNSAAFTAREKQFALAQVKFEEMKKALDFVVDTTNSTVTVLGQLNSELRPFFDPYNKLEIAQKLMALMCADPKGGLLPDETTQLRMKQNKQRLDKLVGLVHKHLLAENPVPKVSAQRRNVKVSGDQLESALNALVPHLQFYVTNNEFAPPELHARVQLGLTNAYTQLLATPLAEKIVNSHIIPAIDMIRSVQPKFELKGKVRDFDFERGLIEQPTVPAASNAATVYAGLALALVPQSVGNLAGPYTFTVSIAAAAEAHIVSVLGGSNPVQAKVLAGRILRFAVIAGSFNGQRFDQVAAAIDANDLTKIRSIEWSKSFQAGPVISSLVSLFYLAALLRNVDSDGEITLKRCADLIQPILGTTLGAFQALKGIGRLSRGLAPYKLGIEVGIPRILAVAALVSSAASVSQEFFAQDATGLVIAGVGTAGALLSVAGFLCFSGGVLEASIIGIPEGIIMQVAGALIGIVATIASAIRDAGAPGTFVVIQGILSELETIDGPFANVAISRPELQTALDDLNDNMDDSHFVFVDSSRDTMILLADIGMKIEHIMRICDENELKVKVRLPPDKQHSVDDPP
jgi:hypothetical protein